MKDNTPIIKVTQEELANIKIGKAPKLSKVNPSAPKKAEGSNPWQRERLIMNK